MQNVLRFFLLDFFSFPIQSSSWSDSENPSENVLENLYNFLVRDEGLILNSELCFRSAGKICVFGSEKMDSFLFLSQDFFLELLGEEFFFIWSDDDLRSDRLGVDGELPL